MPAAIGTETLVNTTTSGNQQYPQIAKLAGGGFVVVWQFSVSGPTRQARD